MLYYCYIARVIQLAKITSSDEEFSLTFWILHGCSSNCTEAESRRFESSYVFHELFTLTFSFYRVRSRTRTNQPIYVTWYLEECIHWMHDSKANGPSVASKYHVTRNVQRTKLRITLSLYIYIMKRIIKLPESLLIVRTNVSPNHLPWASNESH